MHFTRGASHSSREKPHKTLNSRYRACWHEDRLYRIDRTPRFDKERKALMSSLHSLLSRWSKTAMDDTDTLATAVLTGLMAVLALIVLV